MARSKKKRGLFITLEGGEGAGKTSQIARLETRLTKLGQSVVCTREPGGTPGAEVIRHVLLSGTAEPFGPHMEALLFSAARADHVEHVIAPALEKGKTVLCDRFIDSTRVYQGASGKVKLDFLKTLEDVVCDRAYPDLTIVIDLDPKEGMKRAGKRRKEGQIPDRFEKEELREQQLRRAAFLKIARDEPDRVRIVDGSGTELEVSDNIWKVVQSFVDNQQAYAQ